MNAPNEHYSLNLPEMEEQHRYLYKKDNFDYGTQCDSLGQAGRDTGKAVPPDPICP